MAATDDATTLRFYRQARRLTQADLAEQLRVAQSTISKWERGARRISADVRRRLPSALAHARGGRAS